MEWLNCRIQSHLIARVKGHRKGADEVDADGGPDPRDQGGVALETEIQVNGRQTVMGGQIEFIENLGKEHDQVMERPIGLTNGRRERSHTYKKEGPSHAS